MSEFYEGIEAGVRPGQVWCPGCGQTIIDPIVERVCLDCEAEYNTKSLQMGDK